MEIKLKFMGEEERKAEEMESKISEFGGIIEDLEFPDFGMEGRKASGRFSKIDGDLPIRTGEMEEAVGREERGNKEDVKGEKK